MRWLPKRLYHRVTWDLRGVESVEHRKILQGALDACDYPFHRIRYSKRTRVPVAVSDLSRFSQALDEKGHGHVHDEERGVLETGHLLGEPGEDDARRAILGLYWLPTPKFPAGRVELDAVVMANPELAREVFLAEGAHAVDYGVMTDAQRADVFAAYHDGGRTAHGTHGWFEERGGTDYWADWVGESFMSGFTRAFAPSLPQPLEARQPWRHPTTDAIAADIRRILL